MSKLKIFISIIFTILISLSVFAQGEVMTNKEVILMTRTGLSKDLIVRKIKETEGRYETTAEALIELKKAGVADDVIKLMMDADAEIDKPDEDTKSYSDSDDPANDRIWVAPVYKTKADDTARIVLDPAEALKNARTIAIKKSSLHPSRQALEKELLKRKEWKDLKLNIVRYKEDADLLIEIGYVSLSWITHRYSYRIFDNKSGTVIAAGETTSWGSLAENLARGIAKRLHKAMNEAK